MRFLPQERRRELIVRLTEIGMPPHIAEKCASFSHDLTGLDKTLASIVNRLGERCSKIRRFALVGNEDCRKEQDLFLQCDLAIFESYRNEITQRKLPVRLFPRLNRSIGLVLGEIELNKQCILTVMGRQGQTLQ